MKKLLAKIIVRLTNKIGIPSELVIVDADTANQEHLLQSMEGVENTIASIVGMRNGLMAEGFPEDIATQMVKDLIASMAINKNEY
jgi:hypothetical protein